MKSKRAKEAIERYRQKFTAGFVTPNEVDAVKEYCRLFAEVVELAEQDAEEEIEKVKARAVEAFCTACRHNHNGECRAFVVGYQDDILHESCANVLSWENGHLFCESGYHKFIQKLNEK